MASESKTFVARLTPPGKSAIACLGIAGPRAWDVIRPLFHRPKGQPLPETPKAPSLFFGSLGDAASGSDSVVLFVRQIEPTVVLEITCHGGPEVLRLLESLFAACGVRTVALETWTSAMHGSEHAAVLEIVSRCPTTRTAAIALDQLQGACSRVLADIDQIRCALDDQQISRLRAIEARPRPSGRSQRHDDGGRFARLGRLRERRRRSNVPPERDAKRRSGRRVAPTHELHWRQGERVLSPAGVSCPAFWAARVSAF